jgi:hypothetical protein
MVSVRRLSALGMLSAFSSVLVLSSCLYDSSDRCDPGQAYDSSAGLCVCTGHSTPGMTESGSQGCVCEEGYQRPSPEAECEAGPDALGRACEADQDCPVAPYDTCHLLEDGSGYCTNVGCAADECEGGYACDTVAEPTYCARPPSGAGKQCKDDADCAGTEATWCDIYSSHVCYVEGCAVDGNDCPGKECCDLAAASAGLVRKTICVDPGTCKGAD